MAPGALSIFAPFLGRKFKKYEKLETEDPEKRRREATEEEIDRLNAKIGRLVTSMSKEDQDLATSPEDACLVCCRSRATMQVAPCNHQAMCRLCFVHNIQDAVASRNLPLSCMICNAKIFKVKNNPHKVNTGQNQTRQYNPQMKMPKSVSGYSLSGAAEEEFPRGNKKGLPMSASSYSGFSSVSSSSFDSNRSVKSSTSVKSTTSQNSVQSNSSWFTIGSLSSFQAGGIMDSKSTNKPPRAHSLSSARRKSRPEPKMPNSKSDYSVRSWNEPQTNRPTSSTGVSFANQKVSGLYREPRLNQSDSAMLYRHCSEGETETLLPTPTSQAPLSPNSIDERIRAVQSGLREASLQDEISSNNLRRMLSRDSFRLRNKPDSLNIDNNYLLKGQLRRLSGSGRFPKSPDLIETTFSMSTIEEEQEITLSLKNLAE